MLFIVSAVIAVVPFLILFSLSFFIEELKNIDFSSEEHKKLVQKRGNLIDELALQDVAMSFDSIPHINHFRFNDKYFNGKMPTSRKKFAVALRDLAERFLDYAKHFSEGGDTPA